MSRQHTQTPQPAGQDYETPQSRTPLGPETPGLSYGQTTPDLAPSDFDYEASLSVNGDTVGATSLAVTHSQEPQQDPDPFRITIKLECGEDLKEHYWVYLGRLRSCSKFVADLVKDAESLRMVYQEVKDIKAKLKSIIMPELAAESFKDNQAYEALQLMRTCLRQYPQKDYQSTLVSSLSRYAENSLYQDPKKMRTPLNRGGAKNKTQVELPLIERLHQLTAQGVRSLALELYRVLRVIRNSEKKKAKDDIIKAAAQRRILLPDFDRRTVSSLVAWLTTNDLIYEDAEHLCKIYALARRFEIDNLARACMGMLSNSMLRALELAKAEGKSLKSLLEKSEADGPSPKVEEDIKDVVPTVFKYVLVEKEPPLVLRDLVIHALRVIDDDLQAYELIKPNANKELISLLYKDTKKHLTSLKPDYSNIKLELEYEPM